MNFLCKIGLHNWKNAPFMRLGLSGNTYYRECQRQDCKRKEEVYESVFSPVTLTKKVDNIPEVFLAGKEE